MDWLHLKLYSADKFLPVLVYYNKDLQTEWLYNRQPRNF